MKKNIITAFGLVSLVVLSYVGISQLQPKNDAATSEQDAMDVEQEEDLGTKPEKAIAAEKKEELSEEEKSFKTLPSGLKSKITQEGKGHTPIQGEKVHVHYTGWLYENKTRGKKFDSSFDRKTPLDFNVGTGRVIPGWDEGIMLMKVGEKRTLIIPPHLAYGERGMPPVIPKNATLMFDVWLVKIG